MIKPLSTPVVISHLLGGIGNQMFQYAAGRSLSLTHGRQLLLDLDDFSSYSLHNGFELERVFALQAARADQSQISQLLKWRAHPLAKKILRRRWFSVFRGQRFVVEPHFHYWDEFQNLDGSRYLYGYWQSERYFQVHEKTIRKDLEFRIPLSGLNQQLAYELATINAVSLHVRRGDYVSEKKNADVMAVCSIAYYEKAIAYIAARVKNPTFYIFSDDIAWVKKNLSIPFSYKYVNHNRSKESYRDMQLMSLCKHHIIANSSFSWWGAWLNPNKTKIVVAPKSWFVNGNDAKDLTPLEWTKL